MQGLVKAQIGKNGRQRSGEHGFSASRRPDEQNIVSARGSHFEGAFSDGLPLDEREIVNFFPVPLLGGKLRRRHGRKRFQSGKVIHRFPQRNGRIYADTVDIARLPLVCLGDDKIGISLIPSGNERGKHTRDGAQFSVQGEFAQKHGLSHFRAQSAVSEKQTDRYRQVERRPFFPHIGGREIDGDFMSGKFQDAVFNGAPYPFFGFLHRRVGQSHHFVGRQTA